MGHMRRMAARMQPLTMGQIAKFFWEVTMPAKLRASSGLSRRDFLSATGAAISAAVLPFRTAQAQGQGRAKYRRLNVSNPRATRVLDSYKKAIRAMLALPPTDPRNWYRNAFVHTLDCPHGNWWFLVWHRGYIG